MKTQSSKNPLIGPFLLARPTSPISHGLFLKRTFFALLFLAAFSAFPQGWVNFMNSPATLFSVVDPGGPHVSSIGTFYFSLLTAPAGTGDPAQFTFSGLYATNQATAGRFFGGTFLAAPNWAIGSSQAYLIAGWSASLGYEWNQAWLNGVASGSGYFGVSSIATGIAGGIFDTNKPPIPPLNLFGGATGIASGILLYPVDVPEPSTAALAACGAGLLFHWRRRSPALS